MPRVTIIGAGVIGAGIAYELSLVEGLRITLLERETPAYGSTGAALGVLMGAISHKVKGKPWRWRKTSLQRYETLIPELLALTGKQVSFNRQGIIKLRFVGEDVSHWEKLVTKRHSQDWALEIWHLSQLQAQCPQIQNERVIGAVYSPQDRQVNPRQLTEALVAAAELKGVKCQFGVEVEKVVPNDYQNPTSYELHTTSGIIETQWLIIAAGNGSTPLTTSLNQPVDIRPVLGQALQVELKQPLGNPDFQPVITGEDTHIVPLGDNQYWLGATVEFPNQEGKVFAQEVCLEELKNKGIALCPALAQARIVHTWSGNRPRPEGRPAPIVEELPAHPQVLLATAHYRNGVLLAPATALAIKSWFVEEKNTF
ncbi:MAG: FAD-dependent oxidoreductase [Spirulinaceae cyanobacterium]